MGDANAITESLSWTYTVIFMIALYFQIVCVWRWRSIGGLSFEWIHFSILGYFCMCIFSCGFYFSEDVQSDFKHDHPKVTILPIGPTDIILAINGLCCSFILLFQHCIYRRKEHTKYSFIGYIIILCSWSVFVMMFIFFVSPFADMSLNEFYQGLAILFAVSVVFRYPPQISLIFRLRSTHGWSMMYIYLYLIGMVFFTTKTIYIGILDSWVFYAGNLVQIIVILVTVTFQCFIIIQHFTICKLKNQNKISHKQLKEEQKNLSQRIYYEDDSLIGAKIEPYQIIEEYTPQNV